MVLAILLCCSSLLAQNTRAERAQQRIVAQETRRLESAQRRTATRVKEYLYSARRKADLLARTAAVEAWQDRLAQKYESDLSFGKYAHLYSVPAWPKALSFFNSPVQVGVEYSARRASRCCDESGSYTDMSYLVFGSQPKVKDVLLASAMTLKDGVTADAQNEFVEDLAATPLLFTASHIEREVALSCALGMKDNALTLGIRLPFIEQVRTLRVWPNVDTATRTLIREGDDGARNTKFREYYGIDVATFFQDVIERKGMRFDERIAQFDVGDLVMYATASLFPQRVERWQVGAQFTLPTASLPDIHNFYPLQIGNGGFWAAKAHAGVMGTKKSFGSPHGMVALTIGFPATVTRRVPRRVVKSTAVSELTDELFGQDITMSPIRTVDEPETTIAAFAQQTAQVSLRPGIVVDFRCGTVIEPLVTHGLQADLYYHLQVKGGNKFYKSLPDAEWYTEPLVRDGLHIAHSTGCSILYQPDAHMSVRCGLEGTFAGVRTPLWFGATTSLSYEW